MANFKIISLKKRKFLIYKIHGFPVIFRNARHEGLVKFSTCFFHKLLIFKTGFCQF